MSHFASCKIDQNNRSICARTIGVLDLNAIATLSITISHDLMIFTNTCMSQILYTIKILEPNVSGHVSVLRGLFADYGITARSIKLRKGFYYKFSANFLLPKH